MASKRTLKRRVQRRRALYRSIDEMAGFECPTSPMIGLDYFVKLQQMNVKKAQCVQTSPAPQMEDKTMHDNQLSPEKKYLLSRVDEVYWDRNAELADSFNLSDDPCPKTFAEMRERLLAGKFTLPEDEANNKRKNLLSSLDGYNFVSLDHLSWRDPERKPDYDGYEVAKDALGKLKTQTRDEIIVHDQTEGLKALNKFETHPLH